MDINTLLKQHNFSFLKGFGQNFITDTNLLNAIVADSCLQKDDVVLEVGTGAATLTRAISAACKRVVSFEIDKRLQPIVEAALNGCDNVEVVFRDILRVSIEELASILHNQSYKVVANLPYYITTPIIFHFLADPNCTCINIMVQKEVAQRLVADVGSESYGAVTAQVRAYGEARITRIIKRNVFVPAPNVDSAFVTINISKYPSKSSFPLLQRVIAAAFDMRRKTLANNLVKSFGISKDEAVSIISQAGLDPSIRGEKLSLDDFDMIALQLSM